MWKLFKNVKLIQAWYLNNFNFFWRLLSVSLSTCAYASLFVPMPPQFSFKPYRNLHSSLPQFKLNSFISFHLQLFEGMKAYRGVDGKIRIFRPDMNMARMNLAAQRSGLPTFEGKEFVQCLSHLLSIDSEWVPHTESASLYIRPTLIGIDVSSTGKDLLPLLIFN